MKINQRLRPQQYMGTVQLVFVEDPCGGSRGSDHCACLTGSHVTFPFTFFPYLFPVLFSLILFFPYFFPELFSRVFFWLYFLFFPYFFSVLFPVLFYRTFSKVATFEIQRFKISVSCFSSTLQSLLHSSCSLRNIHANVTRHNLLAILVNYNSQETDQYKLSLFPNPVMFKQMLCVL